MAVKNQVQLITYPDSFGGNLKALNKVLNTCFPDVFKGGIHILPPFPSSGDRGFAPLTYLEIDPAFGTWEDIQAIGENFDVLLDLMVNHISKQSVYFQDFLRYGRNSANADLFLTTDKIWADGQLVQSDISAMFLRRPKPYSEFPTGENGKLEKVWTTFGKEDPSEQIDLDIHSEQTRNLLSRFLENFSIQKVKIVRLDAVGYVIKKPGTSCFFVEPEIYEFLNWVSAKADSLGLELLPEVHAHYKTQFKLAREGYYIYDFILPYTILSTLVNKSSAKLREYLAMRPHRQFTMLDCHDGIPVKPDLDDLENPADARKLVDICLERGANLSLVHSDKHKDKDGFDVHQIRGSYFSLLGSDDDAYLAARALQFFTPGIPQVYYVGMLAGENDTENVKRTGEGREINRHNFTLDEIEVAMEKPVVKRLVELIRFRNDYQAFNGDFTIHDTSNEIVELSWKLNTAECKLSVDLSTMQTSITYSSESGKISIYKV